MNVAKETGVAVLALVSGLCSVVRVFVYVYVCVCVCVCERERERWGIGRFG
jgi:hypothetical protein